MKAASSRPLATKVAIRRIVFLILFGFGLMKLVDLYFPHEPPDRTEMLTNSAIQADSLLQQSK